MAQSRFYVSSAFPTTLPSGCGASGNIQVAALPGTWPASYPYTVLLDWGLSTQEAVSVTGAPTGGGPFTLPCTRGIDGTTAQSHATGASAAHGVSAQDFTQWSQFIDDLTGTAASNFDAAGAAAAAQAASLAKASNLSDVASAGTARTNLGLGTAATQASSAFDAAGAATAAQAAAIAASLPTLTAATASASATLAINKVTQVTAASNLTMTLPTPVAGALIVVERESASAGTVTVSGNIRGAAGTVVLSLAAESEMFLGTASTWDPVAGHKTLGSLDARYVPLAPLPSGDVTGAKDTAALQAYINAVPAGSEITLNAIAPYYISSGLTISKALSVRGNAVINQVTSNTPGIVVTAGGFTWDGPALNGPQYAAFHSAESAITITGPSAGSPISFARVRRSSISGWGAYGVYAQYASDVVVHDNDVSNIQYGGIVFLSVTKGQVAKNRIGPVIGSSSNSGNCYGISLSEAATGIGTIDPVCQNILVEGNLITNAAQWTGIDMHAGTNVTITGNIVQGCWFGIAVVAQHDTAGTPVAAAHRVKITGNVVDAGPLGAGQGAYGIAVTGAIVTNGSPADCVTGSSVTGNEVYGYGLPYESSVTLGGITAIATQGLAVSGNTIESCGPAGICLYHDNYAFDITGNNFTDTWSTLTGHAAAVYAGLYNTGVVHAGSIRNLGAVLAQAVIDAASVGLNVSSVTTLTVAGSVLNTTPASVFATSGSVTVPVSTGTAVLAYTGLTATTLTGVTLSSGSGTISAGFASQAPAFMNQYGLVSGAATNSITYYPGHPEVAVSDVHDSFSSVTTETPVLPNIQWFNGTPGTYTWTKPAAAQTVFVFAVAGGGQGGSGRSDIAGTARCGGGGGGGGGISAGQFAASDLAGTVTVTVGSGGSAGGASVTGAAVSGNNGQGGSNSQFGPYIYARAGAGGGGGTASSGTAGAGGTGTTNGLAGAAASTTGLAGVATAAASGAGGGASGGGITSANVAGAGAAASSSVLGSSSNTSAGGSVDSTPPTGGAAVTVQGNVGCGAGSGAASVTASAQAGASAAGWGAGGGGGGAVLSTFSSGAGGSGGQGYVLVITYFQ